MKHGTSVCELMLADLRIRFSWLQRVSGGPIPPFPSWCEARENQWWEQQAPTPAPEWVAQRVSLLPWSGLLLGKCMSFILSTGLEDMQGMRKVSPMWGAEWK